MPYNKKNAGFVGVLGLGKTGIATVCLLLGKGYTVLMWDDRDDIEAILATIGEDFLKEAEFIKLAVKKDFALFNPPVSEFIYKVSSVIASPGIGILPPKVHPIIKVCIDNNISISSDYDLLWNECPNACYIGITGTNGKSTTTALLGHIFQNFKEKVAVGGNIGTSALTLPMFTEGGTYILESSSFQIERLLEINFDIAILLNITPDHQDRYLGFKEYSKAKSKIFEHLSKGGSGIICIDSPACQDVYNYFKKRAKVIPISTMEKLNYGFSFINNVIYVELEGVKKSYNIIDNDYLPGEHNKQNMVAAFAASFLKGLNPSLVIKSMSEFKGLKHRMQFVDQIGGVKFINDSKATNADACAKALQTYEDIYLIAGGVCKDEGIGALSDLYHKIKHVYLIGQAEEQFSNVLKDFGLPYTKSHTLIRAMEDIKKLRLQSGVVLLSPACASFDQWRNFEERGDAFCKMVERLFKDD